MKTITLLLASLAFAVCSVSAYATQITDTITVDGTEWAQVDLFTGLSWSDMNAVCPSGNCTNGGTLNGFDMTDWRWVGVDDVNALFNYYIGSPQMGPGPDDYFPASGSFASDFFADGWLPTQNYLGSSRETVGYMFDTPNNVSLIGAFAGLNVAYTNLGAIRADVISPGGWFAKSPAGSVPVPATPVLFGLGLVGLGLSRRKSATPGLSLHR
jgi:hypothetical protein